MTICTVITAHTSRVVAATQLATDLPADCVFMDDGTLGEPGNTRRALRWAEQQKASHVIVLQDDAEPVRHFLKLATEAINERPDHLISYYLGTGRPIQIKVARLIQQADANGSHWINTARLYWGLAWSTPTAYLPSLNQWLAHHDGPTDRAIGYWARTNNKPCTHTWPSLVDHTDGPSLIHADAGIERKAWRTV